MDEKDHLTSPLTPWVAIWALYTICWMVAKSYAPASTVSGIIILSSNLIVDIVMISYAFWLWRNTPAPGKSIFGLLFTSLLCLLATDVVYNILYNVLHIPQSLAPISWAFVYNILYFAFLLFQFLVWISVLLTLKPYERRFIFLCVPVIIILLATFLIYIFATQWNPESLTLISFYDGWDEIFELISFFAAALCLITAKNRGIFYIALGYMTNMGASFVIDFKFFSQAHGANSTLETVWTLGAIFTIYGLILFKKNLWYTQTGSWIELPVNTRSQMAFWGFIASILAFVILTTVAYFFNL